MTEHTSTPEHIRSAKPELVRYDNGECELVLDRPGIQVNFNTSLSGSRDRDSQAFDTAYNEVATMVGLDCRDYDGNRTIFVAGTAFDDLVCKLDIVEGKTLYTITEDLRFNAALAERPMTIGARHGRIGDRKLTKVYALPQTGVLDGSESRHAPAGASGPLGIASRLFQEHLERKNQSAGE